MSILNDTFFKTAIAAAAGTLLASWLAKKFNLPV